MEYDLKREAAQAQMKSKFDDLMKKHISRPVTEPLQDPRIKKRDDIRSSMPDYLMEPDTVSYLFM